MNLPKLGDRISLSIDRLAIGGRGVGRHEGLVVFVEDAAPEEQLEVEITLLKKNFAEARIVQILKPSPHRLKAPCSLSTRCGGCSWQHVRYEEQLRQKQSLVYQAFQRFSGFKNAVVAPVVPSPLQFRYRNRIQVHRQGAKLGFHGRGTHEIIDATDCLIAEEALTQKFAQLRQEGMSLGQNQVERIQIYRDQNNHIQLSGGAHQSEVLGFSQVNSAQNESLVRYVLERFQSLGATPLIMDLYSGSGNFAIPLAQKFSKSVIHAVELNAGSVDAGILQTRALGLKNLQFLKSSVEAHLNKVQVQSAPLAVLLDPPRDGAGVKVMERIHALNPLNIVYISCHPVTLARDLAPLARAGWSLSEVQPFDMFPQTDHVETVAVLHRPAR
jgi:23S rRNA (uracil1939-C5)-methyltransferase